MKYEIRQGKSTVITTHIPLLFWVFEPRLFSSLSYSLVFYLAQLFYLTTVQKYYIKF